MENNLKTFLIMTTIIGIIGFLLLIYSGLSFFTRKSKSKLPFTLPSLLIGLAMFLFAVLLVKIDGQSVGVVVTPSGVRTEPLKTGWHFIMPWNNVYKMDKTVWVYTFTNKQDEGQVSVSDAIWAPTKDGIKMGFDVSVSWKINADMASWVYSNISEADGDANGRYKWIEDNVIRAKTKSAMALTISEFTPVQAYSTGREKIQQEVFNKLSEELAKYNIILDNVNIREVFYNGEYEKAINNKKLAEQEALRLIDVTKQKEELLKQAEIDKNIAIQKAEGEAKALQIKGSSIANNPKIIELEWIQKWDGVLPSYMMGSGQGVMINLK